MTSRERVIRIRLHELSWREGMGWHLPGRPSGLVITDGQTAGPGVRCMAWSKVGKDQCPKQAAVTLLGVHALDGRSDIGIHLCGGHFDVHRRGTDQYLPGL